MPVKEFRCPDGERIEIAECLQEGGCRMANRCATRSYLRMAASDREWRGKPSTTQLIGGTMLAFLRITRDYAVSPDDRAFMLHGTKGHAKLESYDDEYSLIEERFDGDDTAITGIMDVLEVENGRSVLVDHKTSGSYKVMKALGFFVDEEETGEFYKSGKRKGEQRTRKVLKRLDSRIDMHDWELQLNSYRMELEKRGFSVDEMRVQCVARDGNTWIARSRGVVRNLYYFSVRRLDDSYVTDYFERKRQALLAALQQGYWKQPCSAEENWDGLRCARYCEVAEFCPYGRYLVMERKELEMPIKGLSDIRRLPRLGKIKLGVMAKNAKGVEYPKEVDYFVMKPETPSDLENQRLIDKFHKLYGDQAKSIQIMLPLAEPDMVFPQYYKRYGRSTLLQCRGDGEVAYAGSKEFAEGLEVIDEEDGRIKVKCTGRECPYYDQKKCTEVATLQVLLPELEGAGVWQITTGSYHSIVNINSSLDYIRAMAGRFNMIPLTLERRAQDIQSNGKKTTHYILHINMNVALADLQRYAQIDATKILLELPEVEESKEDILFQTNALPEHTNGMKSQMKSQEETEPDASEDLEQQPEEEPQTDRDEADALSLKAKLKIPDQQFGVWLNTISGYPEAKSKLAPLWATIELTARSWGTEPDKVLEFCSGKGWNLATTVAHLNEENKLPPGKMSELLNEFFVWTGLEPQQSSEGPEIPMDPPADLFHRQPA